MTRSVTTTRSCGAAAFGRAGLLKNDMVVVTQEEREIPYKDDCGVDRLFLVCDSPDF